MDSAAFVVIVFAATVFLAWTFSRPKKSGTVEKAGPLQPVPAKTGEEYRVERVNHARESARILDLRQNLRRKVLYDEAKLERLIEFERERMPTADLEDCLVSAIQRWERENR